MKTADSSLLLAMALAVAACGSNGQNARCPQATSHSGVSDEAPLAASIAPSDAAGPPAKLLSIQLAVWDQGLGSFNPVGDDVNTVAASANQPPSAVLVDVRAAAATSETSVTPAAIVLHAAAADRTVYRQSYVPGAPGPNASGIHAPFLVAGRHCGTVTFTARSEGSEATPVQRTVNFACGE